MKKITLLSLLLLSLIAGKVNAQITLEKSYPANRVSTVHLTMNGEKWLLSDTGTVFLNNMDHSPYRSINVTASFPGYTLLQVLALSDNLFNSNPSVEFVVVLNAKKSGTYPSSKCLIIDETMSIIKDLDSANYAYLYRDIVSNSHKLATVNYYTTTINVYGLPGSIPCISCSGTLGAKNGATSNPEPDISEPAPNPTSGDFMIGYSITDESNTGVISFFDVQGKEVRSVHVNSSDHSVMIHKSDFAPGNYFYNLKTNTGISQSKKLVIIR